MSSGSRIGLWMPEARLDRLDHVKSVHKVSRSKLIAAFCAILSDREVAEILKRYAKLEEIELELGKIADQNLLQFVKDKTPEDLEVMLEAARRAGKSS